MRFACLMTLMFLVGCSSSEQISEQPKRPADGVVTAAPIDFEMTTDVPAAVKQEAIKFSGPRGFSKRMAEPAIIDTTQFPQQVRHREPFRGEIRSSSDFRPPGAELPVIPPGIANNLMPGSQSNARRISPMQAFPGISQTELTPPDPSLAVGPNHIVQTVNMTVSFTDKEGNVQFQQLLNDTDEPGFFDDVGAGDFVFDPRCFYDHYSNRFFIIALEVYQDQLEAYITIAVSDDDDPHGIWHRYRTFAIIQVGALLYWVDYPGVGFDEDGVYMSVNMILLVGPGAGFGNVVFRSFPKTPLLNGEPVEFTDILNPEAASVQFAHCFGENPAPLSISRGTMTSLRVMALQDPFGSPSIVTSFVDVPEWGFPPDAPSGESGSVETIGGRIMNAHWRNGRLWATHVTNDSGLRPVVRWYEIETGDWPESGQPTLVQSGDVNLGEGYSTFFPAIYTDNQNNAAIVMGRSREGEEASVAVAGRFASDPPGTMSQVEVFQIGTGNSDGRWGDYYDIAIDPTDGMTFWMAGQTQEPFGWQTWVNSFVVAVPGDINGDGLTNLLDVQPFVDILLSDEFDPVADLNNDGIVNLLDVGPFIDIISAG